MCSGGCFHVCICDVVFLCKLKRVFFLRRGRQRGVLGDGSSDVGSSGVIGRWSFVVGHWSLVIGHWSLVIGHWSLVSSH